MESISNERANTAATGRRLLVLMAGILALLVGVAVLGDRWTEEPEAPSARSLSRPAETDDSSEVDALVDVERDQASREVRLPPPEALLDAEPAPKARPAYPVPSKLERASIDVVAVWELTEEPATDQWLSFGHESARTDAMGRASFVGVPAGHRGLTNGAGSHLNVELEPGERRTVTFSIRREFSAEGFVVDRAGAPVKDADVLVCASSNGPGVALASTDADGGFRLEALAQRVFVSARHASLGVSETIVLHQGNQNDEPHRLVVDGGTGALEGSVVDRDGVPVSGAYLLYEPQLLGVRPETINAPARTQGYSDGQGSFRMEALRPGPGELLVRTSNHVVHVSAVEIHEGTTTHLVAQLDPGVALAGRVINDATDEAVVQAYVLIGERGDPAFTGAVTDERGEFLIERTPVASAELTVEIVGDVVHRQQIEPAEFASSPLEIRIETNAHSVHGFVVDEKGQPIAGCEVRAEGKGSGSYAVQTDSDGSFRIHNAPATSTALVVYDGSGDRQLVSLPRALPSARPVTIVVPSDRREVGAIRGRVVGADGEPVDGLNVELEFLAGSAWQFMEGQAGGAFGFDGVPVGQHGLTLRCEGFPEILKVVDVNANETIDLGALTLNEGVMFRLDLTFEPPLGKGDRVNIWQQRPSDGSTEFLSYLGEASEAEEPLGPVTPGPVKLRLNGAGVHQVFEFIVEADGETRTAMEASRTALTEVTMDYSAVDTNAALPQDGEIMSYGQSWILKDASGKAVRGSYRPRGYFYGKPLVIDGLETGADYTLHVTDVEGRSGSVSFQGGTAPTLSMR